MTDRIEENKKAQAEWLIERNKKALAEWLEVLERIKKNNDAIEDLDIKPGDVKYLYLDMEDEGCDPEITKGIYLYKEKDCFNATLYSFSLFENDTPIRLAVSAQIFDTKEEVEAYVKEEKV